MYSIHSKTKKLAVNPIESYRIKKSPTSSACKHIMCNKTVRVGWPWVYPTESVGCTDREGYQTIDRNLNQTHSVGFEFTAYTISNVYTDE